MWFWDYTPASHSYKKPISKKELRKLQENFKNADEISKKARELEKEEMQWAKQELDDMLDDIM